MREPLTFNRRATRLALESLDTTGRSTPDKGDYQGRVPSDPTAIIRRMSAISNASPSPTPGLVLVEPAPWYATAPTSADERRRELEDEHLRLLAQAVGDHLPHELALRAAELAAKLQATA